MQLVDGEMKNVLIIFATYGAASMGPRRIRRIVRHMPLFGWSPLVLTDTTEPGVPESEFSPAPIVRAKAMDLAGIYQCCSRRRHEVKQVQPGSGSPALKAQDIRLTTWINRWVMMPDKYVVWYSSAVKRGREILSANKVDLIFASHQPATNLLVAARLAREFGIPLFVEYRDLWTHSPYAHFQGATRLHDLMHEYLENKVLRHATAVSCAARGIAERLATGYGRSLRSEPVLNYNFYDAEEYPRHMDKPTGTFIISFVGSMYLSREPSVWLKGFREFIDRHHLSPAQVRFHWMGAVAGIPGLESMVREAKLEAYIEYMGPLTHPRALEELVRGHVALHIQAPDDDVHVPGKFFEALGARTPMLAISPPCEITELITRTHGGLSCVHAPRAVADTLEAFWMNFKAGANWAFNEEERQLFSAPVAVGHLCGDFEKAVEA